MKKSNLIITATALTLSSLLLLTGCGTDSGNVAPTTDPVPAETTSPEDFPEPVAVTNELELSSAAEAFPDVNATGSYTKEEVQLALLTATSYMSTAVTLPYFVDGSLVKDGYPVDKIELYLKNYFSYTTWAQMKEQFIDKLSTTSGDEFSAAALDFYSVAYYFGVTSNVTLPQECIEFQNCTPGGPQLTNIAYDEGVDGELIVSADITSNPVYIVDGVEGSVNVNYSMRLGMERSELADFENGMPTFVISGFDNKYGQMGWSKN
jgi:hypothetical protein